MACSFIFIFFFFFFFFVILYMYIDFIHVYRPGGRADSTQGTKFRYQQKSLLTSFICYKLKKVSLKSDFIHIFMILFYTCI